jgi:hypothetical protein
LLKEAPIAQQLDTFNHFTGQEKMETSFSVASLCAFVPCFFQLSREGIFVFGYALFYFAPCGWAVTVLHAYDAMDYFVEFPPVLTSHRYPSFLEDFAQMPKIARHSPNTTSTPKDLEADELFMNDCQKGFLAATVHGFAFFAWLFINLTIYSALYFSKTIK